MGRKLYRLLWVLVLFGFFGANALAYMHARAMTQFTNASSRTASPENLNFVSKTKVLMTGVKIPRPENTRSPDDFQLTFNVHQFKGAKNHLLEAWHIPARDSSVLVILFHGYSDSKDSLLPIAKQLNNLGLSTFSVDFYGSGGSDGSGTTIGYIESIDVRDSFNYAKKKWPNTRIVLYGQSMGGAAILRSIAEYKINPDAIVIESTFDKMVNTVKNRFAAMGVPSTPLAELLVFWGGLRSGFNAFKHNPADYASSVNCPSLVLHGQLDPRVTESQSKETYDQLGYWKKYSSYAHAGHLATMESDLDQWQHDINILLKEI